MKFTDDIIRFLTLRGYDRVDPKAALIDMDGVLYDSMPMHARAWLKMVRHHGLEATLEEFFGYEGMTGAATINLLFNRAHGHNATSDEIKALYKEKTDNFREQGEAPLMAGADRMLAIFEREGLDRVLVTGSGQHSLIDRIDRDYPGAFPPGHYITSQDVAHGKPDPEPYLKGMKKAGVRPYEAIVVENAPCGVTAGARSGAFTVGVATGPLPVADLAEAGAAVVFDSMPAFADALPELLSALHSTTITL